MTVNQRSNAEAAIACRLPDDEFDQRRIEAGALFRHAARIDALSDGVELVFAADDEIAQMLFDFVRYERRCCPTLTYELRFDATQTCITLVLRGAAGLAELVASWRDMKTGAMRAGCACT